MKMCEYSNIAGNIINIDILLDAVNCDVTLSNKNFTALMYLICSGNLDTKKDISLKLMYLSQKIITLKNDLASAYDYYIFNNNNVLDENELKILKGDIQVNRIKPIR